MLPSATLSAHRDQVVAMARVHKANQVRVFGSVARNEDHAGSDIDLLVSFDADASLYDLVDLQEALSNLLRVRVDVVSEAGLRGRGLKILDEARPL